MSEPTIEFGTWSTLLGLGSLHGLIVAGLLFKAKRNTSANRFLAALLVGTVLMITPYTIGYAGFYDVYPWLTFAPFYWQLAFGPLLYFYVRRLGEDASPPRWRWHFLPAALQGAYYGVAFSLPLQTKWAWNAAGHEPYVAPLLNAAILISLSAYWWRAFGRYRAHQAWLEANSARREELHLGWLRGFLWAVAAVVALRAGFQMVDGLVADLNYFDYFPFYLALSLLVYYLGIEGWRHAGIALPTMSTAAHSAPVGETAPTTDLSPTPERDWRALGERWSARVAEAGWWREPDLNLADLARRLGTNTQYLSRALNDGLGLSFSQFVNRLRIEEAKRRLSEAPRGRDGADITTIALEVGFGSKASFNRAFRALVGATPSEYRADSHGTPTGE
ncbi:MAG: helix-turn-helix transcriptional regulator [Xanthomonadaceae bacterium]|nr:helix-turn-helix transcriptional regulator [Xanthomonadaceae bacterium]